MIEDNIREQHDQENTAQSAQHKGHAALPPFRLTIRSPIAFTEAASQRKLINPSTVPTSTPAATVQPNGHATPKAQSTPAPPVTLLNPPQSGVVSGRSHRVISQVRTDVQSSASPRAPALDLLRRVRPAPRLRASCLLRLCFRAIPVSVTESSFSRLSSSPPAPSARRIIERSQPLRRRGCRGCRSSAYAAGDPHPIPSGIRQTPPPEP